MNFDLPELTFCEHDAEKIESELVTGYENAAGVSLAPASPVRIFLKTVAAALFRQRYLIDFSAKQNMLAYAKGEFLDHIGVLVGVKRLQPTSAATTMRFYPDGTAAVVIPADTRFTADGKIYFCLGKEIVIPAGAEYVEAIVVADRTGDSGNGFVPGQIKKIVDPVAGLKSAENVTPSAAGAEIEDDDALRERIRLSVGAYAKAGPTEAYKYHAMSAHQSIVDVQVDSPAPGRVVLYPLCAGGTLPAPEILAAVEQKCSADTVRPLTDTVRAVAPEVAPYDIIATYYIKKSDAKTSSIIVGAAKKAVEEYRAWQDAALGRDINPDELVARLKQAGVKRLVITAPAFRVVPPSAVPCAGRVEVEFGGLEDD